MSDNPKSTEDSRKGGVLRWFRNRLITGIIIALPLVVVVSVISWIVNLVDNNVIKFLPGLLNPRTYLGYDIPGLGLIIALILLLILGMFGSNFIGRAFIRAGERILARVPIVSPTYNAVKQIVTTVAEQKERAFREVCLIEYPRPGLWAVGFVTADVQGAPAKALADNHVCVFVPTTPNPTSGFLLFVPRDDIKILDMTPEEGAKMIISGGMVAGNEAVEEVEDRPRLHKFGPKKGQPKD